MGLLEQAAALDPELTAARSLVLETFLGRGKEALEEGEFEQAEGYLQRALAIDPRGYESLYWAAIAALWQEDYARARFDFAAGGGSASRAAGVALAPEVGAGGIGTASDRGVCRRCAAGGYQRAV